MARQLPYFEGILVAVALFCMAFPTEGVKLNAKNNCPQRNTLYWTSGGGPVNSVLLSIGGTHVIDVGASWPAGSVWLGEPDRAAADLAEFTIQNNAPDYYDISNVNAYDVGIQIQPVTPSGSACKSITCSIANLQSFCTAPNVYHAASNGKHEYCTNTDGPGSVATSGTKKFKQACPSAYSYSKDDATSTFSCTGVTDYNINFCP